MKRLFERLLFGLSLAGFAGLFLLSGFLLLLVVAFFFLGETRKDQLQQLGLLGQHDLRRIEQTSVINEHVDGSFFLDAGWAFESPGVPKRKFQFHWGRTPEEFISTTMPYSKFRFVIDESKTVPTIEFVFSENWLNKDGDDYTGSKKLNPNWFVDSNNFKWFFLNVALVRISKKDIGKEAYLPRQ